MSPCQRGRRSLQDSAFPGRSLGTSVIVVVHSVGYDCVSIRPLSAPPTIRSTCSVRVAGLPSVR